MYNGKKVIGVTPAGRQCYLEILVPHLLQQRDTLDEHHFWVNTQDLNDIEYIASICEAYPDFFFMAFLPDGCEYDPKYVSNSIHYFFPQFCQPNVLYVRFDDDICWIEPNAVLNMAIATESNDVFIAYANIINNAVVSYYQQQNNRWTHFPSIQRNCLCPLGWESGEIAVQIHYAFLESVRSGGWDRYHLSNILLNPPVRVSINCIMWKGESLAAFGGKVATGEEQFLSDFFPNAHNLQTMIVGNALVSHYAFYTQRQHIDTRSDVLQQYAALAPSPSRIG